MKDIDSLIELLDLRQINTTTYEGDSSDIGSPILFGGQVLAQALNAAKRSVSPDKKVHSLHAYFLLAGDKDKPVRYEIELIREGRSFVTRRVLGIQNDKVIFLMAASFHRKEDSPNFQVQMKDVSGPDGLDNWDQLYEKMKDMLPRSSKSFFEIDRPIEFRPIELYTGMFPIEEPPYRDVWMRAKYKEESQRDYSAFSEEILAYMSDYNLLSTALQPIQDLQSHTTMMASLDHSMWFHRSADPKEWLFYQIDSISTQDARGLCQGKIFNREGTLIASVAQEGLMRPIKTDTE